MSIHIVVFVVVMDVAVAVVGIVVCWKMHLNCTYSRTAFSRQRHKRHTPTSPPAYTKLEQGRAEVLKEIIERMGVLNYV